MPDDASETVSKHSSRLQPSIYCWSQLQTQLQQTSIYESILLREMKITLVECC